VTLKLSDSEFDNDSEMDQRAVRDVVNDDSLKMTVLFKTVCEDMEN
jgi:hypothetical protein